MIIQGFYSFYTVHVRKWSFVTQKNQLFFKKILYGSLSVL